MGGGSNIMTETNSILSGKTALVTGGSGFLGNAIVKQLQSAGSKVKILCRGQCPELEKEGIAIVSGDISDSKIAAEAVKDCDIVFHTAAKAGVDGVYQDYYRTNVEGTKNIFDASSKANVKCFVHTSSPSVVFSHGNMENVDESIPYPDNHQEWYPKTKCMSEKYVLENSSDKMPTVALRPHLIWGPGDNHLAPRLITKAKADKLKFIGDGNNLIDTIYIDNAANAHILAAEKLLSRAKEVYGKAFFITNDDPRPISEIINMIIGAAGLQPITATISPKTAWLAGAVLEFVYRTFKLKGEPPITRWVANELSTSHWFDISAAKNLLGYKPLVSIEEGAKNLKNYYSKK